MFIWNLAKSLKTHLSRSPLCSVPIFVKNIKKGPPFSYLSVSKQSYSSSDPTTREAKKEHRWKDEYPV